jgi:hypothetical protein
MFAITDLNAVLTSNGSFPLAAVYAQATGNKAGTFGLLFIFFLSITACCIGVFITVSASQFLHKNVGDADVLILVFRRDVSIGRWPATMLRRSPLSSVKHPRDSAVPCLLPCFAVSVWFSSPQVIKPSRNISLPAILTTAFGAIQLGSKTAFADLSGSFVILSTTSYAMAILPHLLSGRKNVPQGPFWMGKAGFVVNIISVLLIIFTNVMFCFPYAMPVSVPVRNTGPYLAYEFPLRVSSAGADEIFSPTGHELQLSHTRRLCRPDGILVVDSREDAVSGAAAPAFRRSGTQN